MYFITVVSYVKVIHLVTIVCAKLAAKITLHGLNFAIQLMQNALYRIIPFSSFFHSQEEVEVECSNPHDKDGKLKEEEEGRNSSSSMSC